MGKQKSLEDATPWSANSGLPWKGSPSPENGGEACQTQVCSSGPQKSRRLQVRNGARKKPAESATNTAEAVKRAKTGKGRNASAGFSTAGHSFDSSPESPRCHEGPGTRDASHHALAPFSEAFPQGRRLEPVTLRLRARRPRAHWQDAAQVGA